MCEVIAFSRYYVGVGSLARKIVFSIDSRLAYLVHSIDHHHCFEGLSECWVVQYWWGWKEVQELILHCEKGWRSHNDWLKWHPSGRCVDLGESNGGGSFFQEALGSWEIQVPHWMEQSFPLFNKLCWNLFFTANTSAKAYVTTLELNSVSPNSQFVTSTFLAAVRVNFVYFKIKIFW